MTQQQLPKALPRHPSPLAAAVQPLPPPPPNGRQEALQAVNVPREPIVLIVPPKHTAEVPPLVRDGPVPVCPTPRRHPSDGPPQPRPLGPAVHLEPPGPSSPTTMSEPEEV